MRKHDYVSIHVSNIGKHELKIIFMSRCLNRYMKSRLKSDKNMEEITTSGYIKTVIRDEGIRGLYKGLDLKLVQSVLGSAVLFCAKEMLFDWSIWALIALGFRKQFH